MRTHVLWAVFKRNFISYFANPTGYVFVCVFFLLTTITAFCSDEFFNANLANLDQLSWGINFLGVRTGFPLIMLLFIPAITMGIWAEERRQGTDELLLTIPAADLDIVLGKYLGAVAVFTVSLLFSGLCNFLVLSSLGSPDFGLFCSTYLGYWLIGLAMLAIGMVASFLTANITVAWILGALLNAPLIFTWWTTITAIPGKIVQGLAGVYALLHLPGSWLHQLAGWLREQGNVWADTLANWCFSEQFRDFGRGVVTLAGLAYFLSIVAIMLYLSMVLIGRRHWSTGQPKAVMPLHYTARVLALVVAAVGLVATLQHVAHQARLDMTAEGINKLAPQTRKLLRELDPQRPIQIEAFISPKVPQAYVQQRLTLLNLLDELNKLGAGKIEVRVNPTERFTEEADRAEKAFGITARLVEDRQRGGARTQDHIFMGLAFKCGTQKVIVPFIDRGISAEYELVRSICTVSQQARKRVGVINTDAELMGPAFSFPFNPGGGNWPIIDELKKQYEVVQVDATQPIEQGKYDVLLAVQPSAMSPDAMDNFVRAVESGIPAAIFEDPLPAWVNVPGTSMPRRPPGMNPMMMMFDRGPREKGDIHKLWRLLGVDFTADEVIWQDYNPLQKFRRILPDELVFIDEGAGAEFAPDVPSSAGLQHVLFPFPGAVRQRHASELKFQPLVRTGERTGTVRVSDLMSAPRGGLELVPRRSTADRYVLAAHITGTVKVSPPPAKEENKQDGDDSHNHGDGGQNKKQDNPHNKQGNPHNKENNKENKDDNKSSAPREAQLNVILVSDIDMLTRQFFEFRELREIPELGVDLDFDNVTFVLNILDQLAGDDRFIELRSRRPKHRTLTAIEKRIEGAKAEANRQINKLFEEFESKEKELQQEYEKRVKEAEERQDIPLLHRAAIVATARREASLRREEAIKQLQQQRDRERERIETNLELERRNIERQYKFWAVVLPLVVPVSVGLCVFYVRRAGEKEGVAQSRLR